VSPRFRLVAGLVSVCLWATACGSEQQAEYSDENREAFLAACTDAGADGLYEQRVCRCAYDEAEATIPYEQFREINDEFAETDEAVLPQELLDVLAACIIEEGDL
jgi:hypothetical protein